MLQTARNMTRMRIQTLAALSCTALIATAGCDGALMGSPVDGAAPTMDSATPTMDAGAPAIDGPPATDVPAWATALCAPQLGERLWVQSPDDMRTTLTGQWLLCSESGVFMQPQAGIEIGADDRWRMLAWSAGQLTLQPGLEHAGAMQYLDATQGGQVLVQVNFVGDIGGTIISIPVISDVPRVMLIDNNGVVTYRYAKIPGLAGGL